MKIKESLNKKLFLGLIIHAVILWVALALGYNSYKQYMFDVEPLTRAVRDSIKATFPWAILIFSGIYFVFSIRKKMRNIFLSTREYVFTIGLYAVILNLLVLPKGKDVFIPLNLSVPYFVILLTILLGLSRLFYFENLTSNLQPLTSKIQDWLPPIVYRFLVRNVPRVRSYIKGKPSAPFIIAFMTLLIVCAFLLIFKAEKVAEQLANIAYFALVIGVGIEVYRLKVKNGRDKL